MLLTPVRYWGITLHGFRSKTKFCHWNVFTWPNYTLKLATWHKSSLIHAGSPHHTYSSARINFLDTCEPVDRVLLSVISIFSSFPAVMSQLYYGCMMYFLNKSFWGGGWWCWFLQTTQVSYFLQYLTGKKQEFDDLVTFKTKHFPSATLWNHCLWSAWNEHDKIAHIPQNVIFPIRIFFSF